jgi:tetratricopeptide (TPR) repeat protein
MPLPILDIADDDDLLDTIEAEERPVAFLVGAPLSMPQGGGPGVPGVQGMVELVREKLLSKGISVDKFDREIADGLASSRYQRAMAFLNKKTSQDVVNEVVRGAVLQARLPGAKASAEPLELEEDGPSWGLPPGQEALGRLLASGCGPRLGPVLTTNFDPLIQVAIRRAGGNPITVSLARDGSLGQVQPTSGQRLVAHLHGSWRGDDTLHTPQQLETDRPQLEASLRRLLGGHVIVVMAYGGWDDVFMRALKGLLADKNCRLDLRWAFFERDEHRLKSDNLNLFESLRDAITAGRFHAHKGIDAHTFLPRLADRLLPPSVPPGPGAGSSLPPASSPALPAAPALAAPTVALAYHPSPVGEFSSAHRPFYLPYPAKGDRMVGRGESLRRVRGHLEAGRRTLIGQTAAFTGIGGIGKTQLAVEYAAQYGDSYPGGLVWITADQDIDAQLIRIADQARWASPLAESAHRLTVSRRRVATIEDALFVFDNVERVEDIQALLPGHHRRCHLLVTSRNELADFDPVPLELLGVDQALELLASESGRSLDDREAALRIVNFFDGLPLGIELAGAYLRRRRNLSLVDYADELNRRGVEAQGLDEPGRRLNSTTAHEASILRTLSVAGPLIREHPGLEEALNFLAWSAPASMGWSLIHEVLEPRDPEELRSAIELAAELHILRPDQSARSKESQPRWRMHRLVQQVRRHERPAGKHGDEMRRHLGGVVRWFVARRRDFKDLPAFEAEAEHLERWQAHAEELRDSDAWVRLQWLRAYPVWHRGDYRRSWQELMAARGRGTTDRDLTAHLLSDSGVIAHALGWYREALSLGLEALHVRRELVGEKHPDTANNIGSVYGKLGNRVQALKHLKRALELNRRLLGEEHPDTATSYNNVGSFYGKIGKHQEALKHVERALELRCRLLGEEHPDTAASYDNVGSVYGKIGKHQEALKHVERALELRCRLLGEEHPHTAMSFNNVGGACRALGQHRKGLEHQERALGVSSRLLGGDHPQTINITIGVLDTLHWLGEKKRMHEIASRVVSELPAHTPRYKELIALFNASTPPGFRKLGPEGPSSVARRKRS